MKNYESLVDALADVKIRGYDEDFNLEPNCLYCAVLDLRLYADEFNIDEVYRFEENSDPDDNAVLYLISSSMGVKGSLVDGYGVYASSMTFDMARKLRMHQTPVAS